MPNKLALQLYLEKIAEEAVVNTRKAFPLGSCNIKRTAFNPCGGMLQYMLDEQKRFRGSVRSGEALTLVRNEDVRDLPGVYKYEKKIRWLEALTYHSIADIAKKRVCKAQIRYVFTDMRAAAEAKQTGVNERYLAMIYRTGLAKQAKAGNCRDMAGFAFQYICNNSYAIGLECIRPEIQTLYRGEVIDRYLDGSSRNIYVADIDHGCVIIGRTQGNTDWRSWNPETIIIDPWIGRWFYASRLYKENPWPFHVSTTNIRFKIYLRTECGAPAKHSLTESRKY